MNKAKANREANARLELAKKAIERVKSTSANDKQTIVPKQECIVKFADNGTKIKAIEATIRKVQNGSKHVFKVHIKTSLHGNISTVDKAFATSTKANNWIIDHIKIVK